MLEPWRLFRRARRRTTDEAGIHLIEVSVATGVLGIAVIGLAGAMSLGLSAVGSAKQRSVAAAYASERLERVHELPYDQVALYEQPTHVSDPEDPDYDVSSDGTTYTVEPGLSETLVVDTANGAVLHIDDPVQRGNTVLSVHQYVTWVDDAGISGTQDYKRVTVIVTLSNPQTGGISDRTRFSTFVGEGGVVIPEVTPDPSPTSSPTPSPTPTAGPESCDGDTTAPTGSILIQSGAGAETGYTSSQTVQVELEASDACDDVTAELSNDGSSFSEVADVVPGTPTTVTWTVTVGDGTKTVSARFVDGAGNISVTYTDSIVLDQTLPTAPSGFTESSCSISGNDRTATLTWNASNDANLAGYRLNRSVNNDPYEVRETTGTQSSTDTSNKTKDSTRYLVRAYDKAGNESEDSSVITYPKNSC